MIPALILLSVLAVVGLALYLWDRHTLRHMPPASEGADENTPAPVASSTCADDNCALGDVCVGTAAIACQVEPVVYYEDEELDAFVGRSADDYTPDEVEQWRDVLYTLQPGDLIGWGQSVKKRALVMPTAIHDEFVMLATERTMQ